MRRLAAVILAGLLLAAPAAAEEPRLNVYNWSDYIAPDTIPNFEKATGIKVAYDVYDSNETLEAKLLAGHSGYDLVVPSAAPYLARQAASGVYRKIDKSQLKNYANLDPQLLAAAANADPGNEYGVPYMWGTTGFGYNRAMVTKALGDHAPTDSSALIFNPANAKKLAGCGISLLDSAQEMFPAALAYLGRDPLSRDPADLARAAAVIQAIRPYIRKFHSSEYINDLANGGLCVAWGYSGDIVQARNRAREAKNGIDIAYTIPKEGAMIWIDMMAIPADAPHPGNALNFIDYILRPEIVAAISNAVAYANPNRAATPLVDRSLTSDPNVYPPAAVRARLFFDKPVTPQYERLRTRAWTRIKTGQ
ncbi:MAG TPA: polyamine ABC transporter substrate-binding protein [Stellaceae bacterium]|nr:polyamine ABC transporter substrate-binding protein [Stellaceae bacterium]